MYDVNSNHRLFQEVFTISKGENFSETMEIKINKEIRSYQESIFFGLSIRQFFCAVLAVGIAVIVYFTTKDLLHKEAVSWLCIISAVPFAAAGFITYHGMTLEKFIIAWYRSEFMYPKKLIFRAENIYKIAIKGDEK